MFYNNKNLTKKNIVFNTLYAKYSQNKNRYFEAINANFFYFLFFTELFGLHIVPETLTFKFHVFTGLIYQDSSILKDINSETLIISAVLNGSLAC